MNTNSHTIFQFTQLYVNLINERNKEGNTVNKIELYSDIENFFGREYIRLYVREPYKDRKDCYTSLVSSDGSYYAYLAKNRDEYVSHDADDKEWERYYYNYTEIFTQYENDVTYFVSVLMASFPNLILINNLKSYNVPQCWVNEYIDEERKSSHWYEENTFSVNYVINDKDVDNINDYVSHTGNPDIPSPYDARIKPYDNVKDELKEKEDKKTKQQEEKIERQKELDEILEEQETLIKKNMKWVEVEVNEHFEEMKNDALVNKLHEATKHLS